MQLTPEQRAAIEYSGGHLQLLACAGSGKTEVVARRVVALLDPSRATPLAPRNIVAFTYTDRAAAELKARIVRRVRESRGHVYGMAEMFVGTIHSFCIHLLQDEVPEYLRYAVLDETRQRMLIERDPERSGFAAVRKADGSPLARFADTRRYVSALDVLRQAELDRSRLGDVPIAQALDQYRALLHAESLVDYTAQLELAVDVLRRNVDAGARLAERVRHVIVDEYQDTNPLQEQVVRALASFGAELTVVGDDDQTVFQWNGADVENILGFADRYPSARQIRLEANFRSSAPIVDFARAFVGAIDRRLPKAMKPTDAQNYEPGDLLALSFASEWDEARFIARKIHELRGLAFTEAGVTRGLTWSDVAILIRGGLRWAARAIAKVFDEQGIPYVITGVKTLFERPEVRAASALFAFLAGAQGVSETDVREAWRTARVGVTDAALDRTASWLVARRQLLADVGQRDREHWYPFGLQRLFLDALELLEVREERVEGDHGVETFYNLGRFSGVLGDFESLHFAMPPDARVAAFHEYVTKSAPGEHEEGLQSSDYATPDAVRITTVHRAKGLQWPVVFLPGLGDGRFPGTEREQLLWELVPRDAVRAPQRYEGSEDDERRLFYVAVTRAQKFLFASWAPGYRGKRRTPSAYFRAFASADGVEPVERSLRNRPRATPAPKPGVTDIRLTFSKLKPMLECPYRFKLQSVYGFRAPVEEAHGFGKALHDALSEIHRRAIEGDIVTSQDVPRLIERHLHLPYASPATLARLRDAAAGILARYLVHNRVWLPRIEFAEKPVEVYMGDGVAVEGRIDLVYRRDTQGVSVVDLKSDRRAQSEALTDAQLRIYALGFEELTGVRPGHFEVWELDRLHERVSPVDDTVLERVRAEVLEGARRVRSGDLPPTPEPSRCDACPSRTLCGARAIGATDLLPP